MKQIGEVSIPTIISESEVEEAALEILSGLDYDYLYGPDIAPDAEDAEREDFGSVVLPFRLRAAVDSLNQNIPKEAREEAIKKVLRAESQDLVHNNRSFHKMLVNGVDVEYQGQDGETVYDKVWLFDFAKPEENDFLAVNQFTIIENGNNRRPDIILFVNGLPLVVIELKRPDEDNGFNDEEIAFYDALADNESAVELLGNETLRLMAAELVTIIRQNSGVDWTLRKNIQAKMRISVKRLLKKYVYPPDKQLLATENILKQAELLCLSIE